jgi:predicted ATPase/class 3 adenylate cyclase
MSEIRALLLTDVVESTRLSERLGDEAMAAVWAAHDRAARDLLLPWRGREIDKTDGMLLMFERADDAVQYALAYHRALQALPVPLQARAGLHVGPVILRENSAADVARGGKPLEVDGLAKPTAARVMSLARGGQTLLTAQAALALGPDPAPWLVRSHGHWMFKGLADPVEVFEAGTDAYALAAPADGDKAYRVVQAGERWTPLRQVPNNLPEPANDFIGRRRELIELKLMLTQARLVTLLGMGGLGKTRLSLQAATELMAEFPDGVWFLDLAPLRDGRLVLAEAAQVLAVREEPGRSLIGSICQLLRERRVLIVVDNCEHLLQPAAALVAAVLKAAPRVAFIASSREALRVPGEQVFPILPLPVPHASDDVATLLRSAAVRLFVARAQEQRPDFELDAAQAPAVAELVARLEGIPLALELAAARLRAMSVAEINRRLKHRYKLLTGGSRIRDERQQTLRALVDWSYDMLTDDEKAVLQRLAVFRGGFDMAAAEAVCAEGDLASDDVLDLLGSLVEKSLVSTEPSGDELRFRMLETIREYAAEKLEGSDTPKAPAARHCLYFFDLSKQARDGMQGPQQRAWLDRLDAELDNLRTAIAWPQSEGAGVDPFVALKMAVALQNFWIMRGLSTEGRAAVRQMLVHPAVAASPIARAHGLYVGAALAFVQGDVDEAQALLSDCLQLRRDAGSPLDVATTLSTLAVTRLSSGDAAAARAAASEAVALFRSGGHRVGEAISLLQLGQVEWHDGRLDAARGQLEQALALARTVSHPETEGEAELLLGEVALEAGHMALAGPHFERSLAVCAGAGDRRGEATAGWALGRLALRSGPPETALPRLQQALATFDRLEMRAPWVGSLEDLATVALVLGQPGLACTLAAAAQRLRDSAHLRRSAAAQARWQAFVGQLRSALGADFDAAWFAGLDGDAAAIARLARSVGRSTCEAA